LLVLKVEKLLPVYHIHEAEYFMQDQAPCHRAKKVTDCSKNESINIFEWPGNSPDLNPIENAWKVMKSRIKRSALSNIEDLKKEIIRVWISEMSQEYFKKLSDSMPKRLENVIRAKGHMT
jgi:transposase